jgi:DNA-directed RNA polymerase subunit RPC12/RpoP
VKVVFACPSCGEHASALVDQSSDWQCPACEHRMHLNAAESKLPTCCVCGNHELYKRKDFPHGLGTAILGVALVLSIITYWAYEKWWTWLLLIGSAIIDGVMYLIVGDVLVCYRCEAHFRGFTPTDAHQPFEIEMGERYRQEKIRLERMKSKTP